MRALRTVNSPKFTPGDAVVFETLLRDVFSSAAVAAFPAKTPGLLPVRATDAITIISGSLSLPAHSSSSSGGAGDGATSTAPLSAASSFLSPEFKAAVADEAAVHDLLCTPHLLNKVAQLRDAKSTRHATMLLGRSMTGKTAVWRTLAGALTRLSNASTSGDGAAAGFATVASESASAVIASTVSGGGVISTSGIAVRSNGGKPQSMPLPHLPLQSNGKDELQQQMQLHPSDAAALSLGRGVIVEVINPLAITQVSSSTCCCIVIEIYRYLAIAITQVSSTTSYNCC